MKEGAGQGIRVDVNRANFLWELLRDTSVWVLSVHFFLRVGQGHRTRFETKQTHSYLNSFTSITEGSSLLGGPRNALAGEWISCVLKAVRYKTKEPKMNLRESIFLENYKFKIVFGQTET